VSVLALAKSPPTYQRVAVIAIAVLVLLLVIELVRRRRLLERYALVWLLAAAGLFVLGVWQGLLTTLATDVGIRSAPNALFALGFAFVVALLLSMTLVISRLSDQSKQLAQRLALLTDRLSELERERPREPEPPGEQRSSPQ
jgi:hypothetical protein